MKQIKIIDKGTFPNLEQGVNEALKNIDDDAPNIKYMLDRDTVIIEYVIKEVWRNSICCECQYWDDCGNNGVSGICHETGKRIRFNCRACKLYKDVRG